MAVEIFRADSAIAIFRRHYNRDVAARIFFIPFVQLPDLAGAARAEVGDLNADGATVRFGGVWRFFLSIHRLVNRAVEIEHELDGEMAFDERVESVATGRVDG